MTSQRMREHKTITKKAKNIKSRKSFHFFFGKAASTASLLWEYKTVDMFV